MNEQAEQTAIWTPGWYELDQSLVVGGERQKFSFFQTPPESISYSFPAVGNSDLVFFNQLDSEKNCVVRYARIASIEHPLLGPLSRIDTDGLDYIFVCTNGREVVVNAEEEPGICYDSDIEVSDWSVWVTLAEISAPVANLA